jgi:hypothetical protein
MQLRCVFVSITNSLSSYNYDKSPEPTKINSL